jgi:hypothetical protein
MLAAAGEMRRARIAVLPEAVSVVCELALRAAGRDGPMRFGAGQLLAAAVADRALGFGAHDEALLRFLSEAAPSNTVWRLACNEAHRTARAALDISSGPAR